MTVSRRRWARPPHPRARRRRRFAAWAWVSGESVSPWPRVGCRLPVQPPTGPLACRRCSAGALSRSRRGRSSRGRRLLPGPGRHPRRPAAASAERQSVSSVAPATPAAGRAGSGRASPRLAAQPCARRSGSARWTGDLALLAGGGRVAPLMVLAIVHGRAPENVPLDPSFGSRGRREHGCGPARADGGPFPSAQSP